MDNLRKYRGIISCIAIFFLLLYLGLDFFIAFSFLVLSTFIWHINKRLEEELLEDRRDHIFNARYRQHEKNFEKFENTIGMNKHYNILGATEFDSLDDIKKKYYSLAKKYHPDSNKGSRAAEDLLKAVNTSFDFLKKNHIQRPSPHKYNKSAVKLYRKFGTLVTQNNKAKYTITVPKGFRETGGDIYVMFDNIPTEICLHREKKLSDKEIGRAIVNIGKLQILFYIEEIDNNEFY